MEAKAKKFVCNCGFEGETLIEMVSHVEQAIKEDPVPVNHSFKPKEESKQVLN
jgi:hypothetical protein